MITPKQLLHFLTACCFFTLISCDLEPVENMEPTVERVDVTFKVDMQNETLESSTAYIYGEVQDMAWELETLIPMANTSADIWEVTLKLEANRSYEYKFLRGTHPSFAELVSGGCGVGEFANRKIEVEDVNLSLELVCFGKCVSC